MNNNFYTNPPPHLSMFNYNLCYSFFYLLCPVWVCSTSSGLGFEGRATEPLSLNTFHPIISRGWWWQLSPAHQKNEPPPLPYLPLLTPFLC